MRISEKSWHYRYYSWLFNHMPLFEGDTLWIKENPNTLCSYFWSFGFVNPVFFLHWLVFAPFVVVAGGALLILLSPVFLVMLCYDSSATFRTKTAFVCEAYKSTKSKVCPLLKWYD